MDNDQSICFHCGKPATLLCDFIIGHKKLEIVHNDTVGVCQKCNNNPGLFTFTHNGKPLTIQRHCVFCDRIGFAKPPSWPCVDATNPEMFTCDRPLCESCATQGSPMFFDGTHREVVIPDYCKDHAGQREEINPITAEDADSILAKSSMRLHAPIGSQPSLF